MKYHMKMVFGVSLSVKSLNEFLEAVGEKAHPVSENAAQVTIEQTVPFVPTPEILAKYAEIIKESYSKNDKITVESAKFLHYTEFDAIPEEGDKGYDDRAKALERLR